MECANCSRLLIGNSAYWMGADGELYCCRWCLDAAAEREEPEGTVDLAQITGLRPAWEGQP